MSRAAAAFVIVKGGEYGHVAIVMDDVAARAHCAFLTSAFASAAVFAHTERSA